MIKIRYVYSKEKKIKSELLNDLKEELENLIKAYTKHVEYLKSSPSYADTANIQTVVILRNAINDLKVIVNNE